MRTSIIIGWIATIIYLLALRCLGNLHTIKIPYNFSEVIQDIGNAATPLILIWAVIGYTIQAYDNKKTIDLLLEEKNQKEKKLSPHIRLFSSNVIKELPDHKHFKVHAQNLSEDARYLHIKLKTKSGYKKSSLVIIKLTKDDEPAELHISYEDKNEDSVEIECIYIDILGRTHTDIYQCKLNETKTENLLSANLKKIKSPPPTYEH